MGWTDPSESMTNYSSRQIVREACRNSRFPGQRAKRASGLVYYKYIKSLCPSVRLSVGFPFCTRRKLSVRSFSGVFGVADHESGARLALRLSLPGAIHRFGEKTPIFEVISVSTREKLSVCSFPRVFGVADHESGYRFALKLHLSGAIDRFDGRIAYFWGELAISQTRFRGRGRFALG